MTDQEKNIKGIIKNSSNKQSNAPVVKEELIGRYDRKKTISLIRYVLQKMEDKNTPFVPLHYTLIALYNSLALLSDLEPRVMTLEEVLEWAATPAEKRDPIFFEQKEGKGPNGWICNSVCPKDYYFCCLDKDARCWTARPTDEQREATKWDE